MNQITGTLEPETFDTESWADAKWETSFNNNPILLASGVTRWNLTTDVPELTGAENGGKALHIYAYKAKFENTEGLTGDALNKAIEAAASYPKVTLKDLNLIVGRKYHISFRFGDNGAQDRNMWIMNGGAAQITLSNDYKSALNKKQWFVYNNREYTWPETANDKPVGTKTEFPIQIKKSGNADSIDAYYDDLMIMPYYQANYMNTDGTTFTTEQFLFDADGNVATTYTLQTNKLPKEGGGEGEICIGWSTEQNATETMQTVQLENKDLVLYPVWGQKARELTADTDTIAAAAGTTLTLTANAPVKKWTIDAGLTEVAITKATDTEATITAAGYAGEVTVYAWFYGDKEPTGMTVYLYGGTKWRPGLNIITGTEEPYGFDVESDFGKAVSITGAWGWRQDPLSKEANGVAKAGQQYAILYGKGWNPTIEIDRPLDYKFDILSTEQVYVMVNGSGGGQNGDIYKSSYGDKAKDEWKSVHFTMDIMNVLGNRGTMDSHLDTKYASKGIQYTGISGKTGDYVEFDQYDPAYVREVKDANGNVTESFKHQYLYLDNLSYIPYYIITYIGTDGEVAATEYVLYDNETGEILKEYTPEFEGATAFSLKPNGRMVDVPIALENKDLTLYVIDDSAKYYSITDPATGHNVDIPVNGEEYEIPTPAYVDMDIENFRVWLDESGNKLYPGDVVSSAEMNGKVLTAYCQDASIPAMGFSYEGDKAPTGSSKFKSVTRETDDGRSVLHTYQYNSSWEGGQYKNDARITLRNNDAFDPNDYTIVQYMYKATSAADIKDNKTQLTDEEAKEAENDPSKITHRSDSYLIMYYWTSTNGDGYYNDTAHTVRNSSIYFSLDNDYHVIEVDMAKSGNSPAAHPWTKTGKIYGFCIDPNHVSWSADTYIDYLRVYRRGIFEVTYDTNARGAKILHEVAPDTGRGAGTGYLLKGERPEVEGYEFRGWALTPDATAADVVDVVDLKRDLTVYAVWERTNNPLNMDLYSLRSDGSLGMRFSSFISWMQRNTASEYGFVVALADSFPNGDYSGLVFPAELKESGTALDEGVTGKGTTESGVRFLYATSYSKSKNVDIGNPGVTLGQEDGVKINAVLVNIAGTDHNTKFVVRAYIKIDGLYYYGMPMVKSYNDIAGAGGNA